MSSSLPAKIKAYLSKKAVLALLAATLFGIAFFSYKLLLPSGELVTVEMSLEGFAPKEVSIRVGDTVRWVNKDEGLHWPASDLHPTHEIYPEFDPKQPVGPGESWSFTFRKKGTFSYHDHLQPGARGRVEVTD